MKNHGFLNIRHDDSHIDKLFDELIHRPWRNDDFNPTFDLYETEDSYILEADCPGMSIEDIHLTVKTDTLTISGEKSSKIKIHSGNLHFSERTYGKFVRTIVLPADADRMNIKTEMKNGVLKVHIHKLTD